MQRICLSSQKTTETSHADTQTDIQTEPVLSVFALVLRRHVSLNDRG